MTGELSSYEGVEVVGGLVDAGGGGCGVDENIAAAGVPGNGGTVDRASNASLHCQPGMMEGGGRGPCQSQAQLLGQMGSFGEVSLLGHHEHLASAEAGQLAALLADSAAAAAVHAAAGARADQVSGRSMPQLHHSVYPHGGEAYGRAQGRPSSSGQPVAQQQQQPELMMEAEFPAEDSEDEVGVGRSDKRAGRRKIKIEYIEDKSRRHITFSKRKAGIMKKAYELSTLTGTQVLLLVASETGHVYTFATPKLQPLITKPEGKNLIQACLNAPDGSDYPGVPYDHEDEVEDRQAQANASSGMAGLPQNYAAAIAGLTGYQYTGQGSTASIAQAYLNPAHYPAYASQYSNMAAAAAYWPQAQQQASQAMMQQASQAAQGAAPSAGGGGSPLAHQEGTESPSESSKPHP